MVFASPRAKTIIASVAIKGWMSNPAVMPPATAPHASPTSKAAGMAIPAAHPQWMVISEKLTATRASTLPTARSMPPLIMTRVMPHARMPKTEAWRRASRWVPILKKAPCALKTHPINITSSNASNARVAGMLHNSANRFGLAALTARAARDEMVSGTEGMQWLSGERQKAALARPEKPQIANRKSQIPLIPHVIGHGDRGLALVVELKR